MQLIKKIANDVGTDHVVQVVTDNGSNYKKTCQLLNAEYQHIVWLSEFYLQLSTSTLLLISIPTTMLISVPTAIFTPTTISKPLHSTTGTSWHEH